MRRLLEAAEPENMEAEKEKDESSSFGTSVGARVLALVGLPVVPGVTVGKAVGGLLGGRGVGCEFGDPDEGPGPDTVGGEIVGGTGGGVGPVDEGRVVGPSASVGLLVGASGLRSTNRRIL